jgi:hypothetical protein
MNTSSISVPEGLIPTQTNNHDSIHISDECKKTHKEIWHRAYLQFTEKCKKERREVLQNVSVAEFDPQDHLRQKVILPRDKPLQRLLDKKRREHTLWMQTLENAYKDHETMTCQVDSKSIPTQKTNI